MRASMPVQDMNLIGVAPKQGQMTPSDGRLIVPGQPYLSEVLIRAGRHDVSNATDCTNEVSERAIDVLRRWTEELNDAN